jgi:AraC family transcriptional regulator
MPHGCIALAMDACRRPIEISTFRWSSVETGWAGFPIECHVLGPRGQLGEFGTEHVLLGLCVSGVGKMQIRDGKVVRRATSSPGRFSLLCRGYEQKPIAWSGIREMLYVSIGAVQLQGFTGGDSDLDCLDIEPQYAVSDPNVVALVLNMQREVQAGCPSGRLYGEGLSVALAARLQARYARGPVPDARVRSVLSDVQVRRICEYIQANLASDMGVAELADQVHLSPHYFSLLFKHTLGVSPHRYVLQERICEAQRQLASGRMDISELALHLGFSDQSHFSRAFRRLTGMTPQRYRRSL